MESKKENCVFCHPDDDLTSRIINQTKDFTSFLSQPRFRRNHVLVVPSVHYERLSEAPNRTLGEMMGEVALLANCIDEGYGVVTAQKFQPLQPENGIKMNHLHIHAWPRLEEDEKNGIIMPAPRSSQDFTVPHAKDTEGWLRIIKPRLRIERLLRQGIPIEDVISHLNEQR